MLQLGQVTRLAGLKPGVNFEIGLKINDNKVLRVNGPTPPCKLNEISVFRKELKAKVPVGKMVIGDEGYRGEPELISTKGEFDHWEITDLKNRLLAHHESFNKSLQNFGCWTAKFRHGVGCHKVPLRPFLSLQFIRWRMDRRC